MDEIQRLLTEALLLPQHECETCQAVRATLLELGWSPIREPDNHHNAKLCPYCQGRG